MLLQKFLLYGNGTQGGDGDTILYAKVIKKETVYMGIWDLVSFFCVLYFNETAGFFFYFVECGPALVGCTRCLLLPFSIARTFGLDKFL